MFVDAIIVIAILAHIVLGLLCGYIESDEDTSDRDIYLYTFAVGFGKGILWFIFLPLAIYDGWKKSNKRS